MNPVEAESAIRKRMVVTHQMIIIAKASSDRSKVWVAGETLRSPAPLATPKLEIYRALQHPTKPT